MNKNSYIQPAMEVIDMQTVQPLLTASLSFGDPITNSTDIDAREDLIDDLLFGL